VLEPTGQGLNVGGDSPDYKHLSATNVSGSNNVHRMMGISFAMFTDRTLC